MHRLLLVVVLLTGLALGLGTARGAFPGANGDIVFTSWRSDVASGEI